MDVGTILGDRRMIEIAHKEALECLLRLEGKVQVSSSFTANDLEPVLRTHSLRCPDASDVLVMPPVHAKVVS